MAPRRTVIDPAKGVLEVEWQLFGELSRALALKVSREFNPELVVGIANAGVIPGATIASILDRPFVSMAVSRRYRPDAQVRETPAIFGEAPAAARGTRARSRVVTWNMDPAPSQSLAVMMGACR
jgi:hypoxanthine phosphoribosyltransferase